MDKPLITVVITAYNLEKYIACCFEDLLAQTLQDFDLLIIDDASADSTADIIRQYLPRFSGRGRCIFSESNSGSPSRSRNKALDSGAVDGEYVLFLDGDDRLEPAFLETLYETLRRSGADMSVCGYDRVSLADGRILCHEMQGFPPLIDISEDCSLIPYINTALWNKLIPVRALEGLRLPDFSVGEDLCFLLRVYSRISRIAFTPQELIHYQVRGGSVISNTSQETVRALARELSSILSRSSGSFADSAALAAFIHVGISMAIRASQNPDTDISEHLRWTGAYLRDNALLSGRSSLSFSSLRRRGIRGLAVWGCRILYQLRCFRLFLWLYSLLVRITGKDIKF